MQTGKRQGTVIRVNDVASAKLGLFSTLVSFNREIDSPYGKQIANEGVLGVMLSEQKPDDLAQGDIVHVDVVSLQETIFNGASSTIARCLILGKAEAKAPSAAKKPTAKTAARV